MNCPNCGAASDKQQVLAEHQRRCTTCNTVWTMNENGSVIVKQGQNFLAEINPNEQIL